MAIPQIREIETWRDSRLKCGIGHIVAGRVRIVQRPGHDSDGEIMWYPPEHDYEPDTCVVCGLKIWAAVE